MHNFCTNQCTSKATIDSKPPSAKKQLSVKTLYVKSAHSFSLKRNILYNQTLRIKRICFIFEEYRKYSQDLITRFVEKSYSELKVKTQI